MAAQNPRNRIVVFRLTQDEFTVLKAACSERGGRNLSEFTRSELLGYLAAKSADEQIESRLGHMERKLAELHQTVQRVIGLLDCLRAEEPGAILTKG